MKHRLKQPLFLRLQQQGFSLVELMVAMAVGLIISAGAAALFANTVLSTRSLNSATQVQEVGTQIMATLSRHLRMAGYVEWLGNTNTFNTIIGPDSEQNAVSYNLRSGAAVSVFQRAFGNLLALTPANLPTAVSGCDGAYQIVADLTQSACGIAAPTASAFTVAYQVTSMPDTTSAPKLLKFDAFSDLFGAVGDCNNNAARLWPALSGSSRGPLAVNRFYLKPMVNSTALAGEPVLYDFMCQGNGGAAEPFASNIEQFVVLYGIADPNAAATTGSNDVWVASYASAGQISAANQWGQVIAARLCLLIAGERNSAAGTPNAGNAAYTSDKRDCLGAPIALGPGLRLRQTFTSTITLRNQVHTTKL
jgi:type IV pilus assembly protein PilW